MKRFIILALVIFLIVFTIVIFLFLNHSPKNLTSAEKEAAIAKILGRKPNLTDNTKTGDTQYKGKYVSFVYPAKAVIYTQTLNGKSVEQTSLEYFSFDLSSPKLVFSMEVIQVPQSVQTLEDYPGVKLREAENNIYVKKEALADDKNGLVFERISDNGFEKTAFFYLEGKIFSLSISGSDQKTGEQLYMKIISSLKFL